jgi:polysaccharide export outer membrane protein
MPVRSRGSLLAGTAALAGLIVAGLGCHSSYSDHDAFSIPNTAPQSGSFLTSGSGLLPSRGETTIQAGYPAQPIVGNAPAPMSAPVARPMMLPSAATARPVMLQSVPVTQPTTNLPISQAMTNQREVIASSWSPVQRVSAVQPVAGSDLQGGAIPVTGNTPAIPARLPIGSPMPTGNGPVLDGSDAPPPGNIMLPPPRPLGSGNGPMVVMDGAGVPPPHPHDNVPREFEKMALPPYVVEPPDILLIQASNRITLRLQPIQGQHLVGPDGTINLGIYGKIRVAGLTLEQVADAVASRLLEIMPGLLRGVPDVDDKGMEKKGTEGNLLKEFRQDFTSLDLVKRELQVDVLVYSSKFYYVITDGGGYGQQVYPIPIRGNETVLDALANINGLPAVANKKRVWVARATRAGQPPKILPVDWMAVTQCGKSDTNYQLFPGDRVYVDSSHLIKADTFLSKLYSPVLRTFGVTLLGAATVNTIKGTSSGLGAGAGLIR